MKTIHFIFLGAVITIIGGLLPSHSVFIHNTPVRVNFIAILGALITGLSALHHNINSSKKSNHILTNTESHLKQLRELTLLNTQLSSKLADTTLKLQNFITGGDSLCIIVFELDINGFGKILLNHYGEYPIHDLSARICDLEKIAHNVNFYPPPNEVSGFIELPNGFKDDIISEFTISVGTLLVGDYKDLMHVIEIQGFGSYRSFNIFFNAKNGAKVQLMRLFFNDKKWIVANKVLPVGKSDVLYESVDPEFPLDILIW